MKKGSKKIIIIAIVLAVLLVGVGIIITVTTKQEKEPKDKNTKDTRCVEKVCISDVSVGEYNGSKVVNVTLKNEGKTVVEDLCVNLVASEQKYVICLKSVSTNEEIILPLDYKEDEDSIEDYSLEKAPKEEANDAKEKREEVLNNNQ